MARRPDKLDNKDQNDNSTGQQATAAHDTARTGEDDSGPENDADGAADDYARHRRDRRGNGDTRRARRKAMA